MVAVTVRHEHLREGGEAQRLVQSLKVTRVARPGIDQRGHTAGKQPRPVAVSGNGAGIVRMDRNSIHQIAVYRPNHRGPVSVDKAPEPKWGCRGQSIRMRYLWALVVAAVAASG